MTAKKKSTKAKSKAKKPAKKSGGSGLKKFQAFIKKETKTASDKVADLEKRLKAAKKDKAAKKAEATKKWNKSKK